MHIATSGSKIEISKESLTAKIAKRFSNFRKSAIKRIKKDTPQARGKPEEVSISASR